MTVNRCWWSTTDPLMTTYHDDEWGSPVHDDQTLFEFLILEGAQAGLSWQIILNKRENYREAFDRFHPTKVANYTDTEVGKLLNNSGIIRNRLKIHSAITNAREVLRIQEENGSLDAYLWKFVGGKPKLNTWDRSSDIPTVTTESRALSEALIERGFKFVGPTITYAFMQATGMINDHLVSCYRHQELAEGISARRPRQHRT